MKKLVYSILGGILFSIFFSQTNAAISCDQTFENRFLRYDKTYEFYDTWNSGSKATYLNKFKVEYQQPGYYGGTNTAGWYYLDKGSDFHWTSQLKTAGYKVAANASMRVLDTSPTKWRIEKHNTARTNGTSSSYDFMLAYTIDYDFSNNFPNASDDISHTECVYYSVTWCGDGVKDAGYEVCDPNDPTHSGWGNGGCNQTTCEPINVEPPSTCDGLTATPTNGIAPLSVNMSCTGTKASSYQIACGNGQVINGSTGTCTYTTSSNYQAICTVNGNVTSNTCKKTIAVTNPTPAIRIDKIDANTADIDQNVGGNDSQTVAIGNKAVFKIRVTNSGNEDLNNLKVTDPIAPNCAGLVTLPGTKPATWSNFVVAGSGNHNDAFLQPGEYFEYTCEKDNTTAAYDNRANTEGTGITSGLKPTDTDDTKVLLVTPSIQVVKTDANAADLDTLIGDDTQTVNVGNAAIFKIRVVNNGTEGLKEISLADPVAPNCAGSVTLPGTKPATWSNFQVAGLGDHTDAFLEPGEYFEYTCEKVNTTAAYTNEIVVNGKGRFSNNSVSDDDPTLVKIIDIVPACISLNIAPLTGSAPVNANVVCTGEKVQSFKVDCGNGQIFTGTGSNAGQQSFTKTCNYTTVGTYTPKCFINDTVTSPACQKTVAVTSTVTPAIQLVKSDANSADLDGNVGNDTQTVNSGSGAIFRITVTNTGTEGLTNIVLTDPVAPNCAGLVTLPSTYPATFGNFAHTGNGDAVFNPGETFTYTCSRANTIANYTNTANVSANGIVTGATVNSTDPTQVILSTGVNPSILIDKVDANSADLDGNIGNDTQTVNSGVKAVFKIRVTNNGGESLKNLMLTDTLAPNCAGSVTLPGTKPATWLSFVLAGSGDHTDALLQPGEYFEYTCEKDNTTAEYTNIAGVTGVGNTSGTTVTDDDSSVVKIPGSSSSSSSGGGSPNDCFSVEQTATTIRCIGDNQTKNFKLDCGNGKTLISGDSRDVSGSTRQQWDFPIADCRYDTTPKTGIAQCYVATRVGGEPAWRTRFQCQLTETTYCGDGIIQTGEQCEKTIEHTCSNASTPTKNTDGDYICSNGVKATAVLGNFPSVCSSSCKFTGGSTSSSSGGGILTIPNHGDIVFGPIGNMVIGHGKNPLVENGEMPYIRNDSDYDLYFDQLCVTRKAGTTLDGNQTQCKNLGDILYPGETVRFDSYPIYTGNKNNIPAGQSYGSNDLITTIKTEGELYDWAFFASKLGVRVSKPAISTTGGGTSLVKDTSKMANISDVADGINGLTKENNKNFVGVGVGANTSSYSDTVTNTNAIQTVANTGSGLTQTLTTKVNTESVNVALANVTSLESSELKSYNGLQNVFILKGKNLVIDSIPAGLRGAITYIVDGGDLVINGNLLYSENIAFVVKGGNIRINEDVTKITGTYITIPVDGAGGKIIAEESDKQLVVVGSLYGNISELVGNRTYVDNNSTKGVINVGTIVSFGSSLFKKPAPLVGQFISEYVATQKVAQ